MFVFFGFGIELLCYTNDVHINPIIPARIVLFLFIFIYILVWLYFWSLVVTKVGHKVEDDDKRWKNIQQVMWSTEELHSHSVQWASMIDWGTTFTLRSVSLRWSTEELHSHSDQWASGDLLRNYIHAQISEPQVIYWGTTFTLRSVSLRWSAEELHSHLDQRASGDLLRNYIHITLLRSVMQWVWFGDKYFLVDNII